MRSACAESSESSPSRNEPRADRLDDECERVAQERIDLGVQPELQEAEVEVALGPCPFVVVDAVAVVVHDGD